MLSGIVDIYPSMNPLGMDSIKREMPIFDLDMNMIFPGSETGAVAEHIAAAIMNDIKGADICIDIHASNIFLREIPQVRISEETAPKLLPYAKMLNVDFIVGTLERHVLWRLLSRTALTKREHRHLLLKWVLECV